MQQQIERRSREIIKKELAEAKLKCRNAVKAKDWERHKKLLPELTKLIKELHQAEQATEPKSLTPIALGVGGEMQGEAPTFVLNQADASSDLEARREAVGAGAGNSQARAPEPSVLGNTFVLQEKSPLRDTSDTLKRSRVNGTNLRALGTNPRALGTNPRALADRYGKPKADRVDALTKDAQELWKIPSNNLWSSHKIIASKIYKALKVGIPERVIIYQIADCKAYDVENPQAVFCYRLNKLVNQKLAGVDAESIKAQERQSY